MKLSLISAISLAFATLASSSLIQLGTAYPGANELADKFPNSITGVYNASYFILNFPTEEVASVLPSGTHLLPFDVVKASLPDQPEGTHPVLVKIGMDVDVGQGSLTPEILHFDFHNSQVSIPFVDKSGDGATGFIYIIWLGSSNLESILLTLPFAQIAPNLGIYTPDDQPFERVLGVDNRFRASAVDALTSKPIFELEYTEVSSEIQSQSTISVSQAKSIANQAQFQLGLCTFDNQYWNLSRSNPHIIQATSLTLHAPLPSFLVGTYTNIWGVRVPQGGFVETVSQPCEV